MLLIVQSDLRIKIKALEDVIEIALLNPVHLMVRKIRYCDELFGLKISTHNTFSSYQRYCDELVGLTISKHNAFSSYQRANELHTFFRLVKIKKCEITCVSLPWLLFNFC